MDYFVPSDVARLVLGYLKENSYLKTYNCFLKECCHLKEFYNLVKAGRQPRQISQLNLIIILEEWGHFKFQNDQVESGGRNPAESPSSDETFEETLVSDNDVTNSGRKAASKLRFVSKKSPQVKIRKSPNTPKASKISAITPRKGTSTPKKEISNNEEQSCITSPDNLVNLGHGERVHEISPENPESDRTEANIEKTPVKSSQHCIITDSNLVKLCAEQTSSSNQEYLEGASYSNINKSPAARTSEILKTSSSSKVTRPAKSLTLDSGRQEHDNEYRTESPNVARQKEYETDLGAKSKKDSGKVLSRTFIKTTAEPPVDIVDTKDKCLSWIQRNNSEQAGERRPMKNNESHLCDKTMNLETGDRTSVIPGKDNRTSPVTDASSTEESSAKSGEASGSTLKEDNTMRISDVPAETALKLTTPQKSAKTMTPAGDHGTPVKLLQSSENKHVRSPRRKKPKTPRKRASEVSPVSVVSARSVDLPSVNPMFETILKDHRLHEKLAETCNLVHSQMKQGTSGNISKDKSGTKPEQEAGRAVPDETVTGSRSLEELLGIDNNFHTDLLSDNIDMSDPAYASLFKLFGTDRETFSEYLRKEKERELEQMEAEVEELERSNHEILCANFGMSQADAGYETQEVGYNSPHHTGLGTFSTQHGSPHSSHATSTPCGQGVPVHFTPLLRGQELGSSPVHSTPARFGGMHSSPSGSKDKLSPSSAATQPFSPTYSHCSEVNNPPTPRNQQHLTAYINGGSPYSCKTPVNVEDHYMNPCTPAQPGSPHHSQLMHSTPTGPGSVRSHAHSESFAHHSPINPQCNTMTNSHYMAKCSPLVKADLHPNSPMMVQSNTPARKNIFFPGHNSELYYNSQTTLTNINSVHDIENSGNVNGGHNITLSQNGYLDMLNDESDVQVPGTNIPVTREPCTTIENTIGCISLPQPKAGQSSGSSPGKKSKRKRKGKPKQLDPKKFSTLKGLLSKPLKFTNSIPLHLTAGDLQKVLKTPEKKILNQSLTFRSPGGKTLINVPVLNCEDEIDLSVLGMDGDVDESNESVNVYDQNLDASTHYSITPENQATHDLVKAIEAGSSVEVIQKIQNQQKQSARDKLHESKKSGSDVKKTNQSHKKSVRKKKSSDIKQSDEHSEDVKKTDEHSEHFSPTPPSNELPKEGYLDPSQEVYTATPIVASRTATVRALNFGPDVEDPSIAHYRKIFPKMPVVGSNSSVIIVNTNQVSSTGQPVIVSTTPVTLMPRLSVTTPVPSCGDIDDDGCQEKQIDESEVGTTQSGGKDSLNAKETENLPNNADEECTKRITRSASATKNKQIDNLVDNMKSDSESENKSRKGTPVKQTGKISKQKRNLSKELSVKLDTVKVANAKTGSSVNEQTQSENKIKDKDGEIKLVKESKVEKKSENENNRKITSERSKKDKKSIAKEKLRVKIPVGKQKPSTHKIQFYFKKKQKTPDSGSLSEDDLPLSEIRKRPEKLVVKRSVRKEYKSKEFIVESETTDDEKGELKVEPETPKKVKTPEERETPSKEVLLEKIGLTPRKPPTDHEFKSPQRTNLLDVLAEWQSSPHSGRKGKGTTTPRSRSRRLERLKSPTTPNRGTPAKQLFTSPSKMSSDFESSNDDTTKRVNTIINRLNHNNPSRNLRNASSYEVKTSLNGKDMVQAKEADTVSSEVKCVKQVKKGSQKARKDPKKVSSKSKQSNKESTGKKTNKSDPEEELSRDEENRAVQQQNQDDFEFTEKSNLVGESMGDQHQNELHDDNTDVDHHEEHGQSSQCMQAAMNVDEDSQGATELNRAIASIECETDFQTTEHDEHEEVTYQAYEHGEIEVDEKIETVNEQVSVKFEQNQRNNEMLDSSILIEDTELNCGMESGTENTKKYSQVVVAEIHAEQDDKNDSPLPNTKDDIDLVEKNIIEVENADDIPRKECEISELENESNSASRSGDVQSNTEFEKPGTNKTVSTLFVFGGEMNRMQDGESSERRRKHKKKKHKHRPHHRSLGNDTVGSQSETGSSNKKNHHLTGGTLSDTGERFITPISRHDGRHRDHHRHHVQGYQTDIAGSQSETGESFLTPTLSGERQHHRHHHRHKHRHSADPADSQSEGGESSAIASSQGEEKHHRHLHKKKKSKKRHRDGSEEDEHRRKRRRKENGYVTEDSLATLNVEAALSQIYGNNT